MDMLEVPHRVKVPEKGETQLHKDEETSISSEYISKIKNEKKMENGERTERRVNKYPTNRLPYSRSNLIYW